MKIIGLLGAVVFTAALPLAADSNQSQESTISEQARDPAVLQAVIEGLADQVDNLNAQLLAEAALAEEEVERLQRVIDQLRVHLKTIDTIAEDNARQAERLHDIWRRERRARLWDRLGCAVGLAATGDSSGFQGGLGGACGIKF